MILRRASLALGAALAVALQPALARTVEPAAAFVPRGWKSEMVVRGELTGDAIPDVVLLVQANDPARRVRNEHLGEAVLDTNPRRLIVLRGTPGGLRQIAASDRIIPPKGNAESTCLADPLEDGDIKIERGLIKINLNYWASCGSWGSSSRTYTLRVEQDRVRLIGFDRMSFSRASGLGNEISIDYLRGRVKHSSEVVVIGDETGKPPKVRWERVRPQAIYLEDLAVTRCDDLDPQPSWC